MECKACGYEEVFGVDEATGAKTRTPAFTRLRVTVTVRRENDYGEHAVGLYACPMCQTVKMEEFA